MSHPDNSTDDQLYERFAGPNAAYYILKWDVMRDRLMSWNWSAFFFGEGWLLYRKMYLYAIIYSVVRVLITPFLTSITLFGDSLLNDVAPMLMPYTIILNLLIGLYGNHLYKLHADHNIRAAKVSFKTEHIALGVQGMGGVSLLALLLIPIFAIIENFLLFLYANDFSFNWIQTYQMI
jgi:hypothetical protein